MAHDACDTVWKEKRRRPKESEVRPELRTRMATTKIDPQDPQSKTWLSLCDPPRKRKLQEIIKEWHEPKVGPEELWTLDGKDDIDPAANGALVTVWTHVNTTPWHGPFTVELAEWVARLRFVPQAGGDSSGDPQDPQQLLVWACKFSAREKAAKQAKGDDTRTNIVLAKLTMTETQYGVATSSRQLSGFLDDSGIDIEEELLTYYPREAGYRPAGLGGELADLMNVDPAAYVAAVDEILVHYPPPLKELWEVSCNVALENEEWVRLRADDQNPGVGSFLMVSLLCYLARLWDKGEDFEEYDPQKIIAGIINAAKKDYRELEAR